MFLTLTLWLYRRNNSRERPEYITCIIFAFIGWLLLASLEVFQIFRESCMFPLREKTFRIFNYLIIFGLVVLFRYVEMIFVPDEYSGGFESFVRVVEVYSIIIICVGM